MTGARAMATGAQLRRALIEAQRRVLECIAGAGPLEEVLDLLVRLVEEQAGGMRCSILLADAAHQRLRFGAGPSIPQDYRLAMEPYLRIAPDVCACASAAWLRQPVYTRDVAADPMWKSCADIAVRNGMRAVWSTPILSGGNVLLGTFAMGYGEPRLPTEDHIRLIDMATQMARVAVEAKGNEMISGLFEHAPRPVILTDLAGTILRANRAFAELLGYAVGELAGRPIAHFAPGEGNEILVQRLLQAPGRELLNHRRYRTGAGESVKVRERCSLQPDAGGRPGNVFCGVETVLDAAGDPFERLSRREFQVLGLVAAGLSSREIGARLHIAPTSVDTYRSRIMVKLGLPHFAGLVRLAVENGIAAT